MSFWGWIGRVILLVISSGAAVFGLKWWKEARDRKIKNLSSHAKKLLDAAEKIYSIANAMLFVVKEGSEQLKYRNQASSLYTSVSATTFLNSCKVSCWILVRNRKTKKLYVQFESVIEKLRQAAIAWNAADQKWRTSIGLARGEIMIGGKADENTPEKVEKQILANEYQKVFDTFSKVYQELQSNLRPLIIVLQ